MERHNGKLQNLRMPDDTDKQMGGTLPKRLPGQLSNDCPSCGRTRNLYEQKYPKRKYGFCTNCGLLEAEEFKNLEGGKNNGIQT